MRILVLIVFGIGNTINKTPMLKALRQQYPDAEIDVVCDRTGVEVLTGWDILGRIFSFGDAREVLPMPGYDVYVVARPANGWLRHAVSQTAKIVGDWSDTTCWIHHEIEWNMDLAYQLGYEGEIPSPHFELQDVRYPLAENGRPRVGIHIGCLPKWVWKKWPLEHWTELIRLLDGATFDTIMVGGESERADADALMTLLYREGDLEVVDLEDITAMPKVIDLVGRLSLKETAAAIKQCQVFISTDSGPMHMASALGVPTIGLFGPTSVRKNRPWFGTVVQARDGRLDYRPCQERPGGMEMMRDCVHRDCMMNILPEQVMEAAVSAFIVEGCRNKGDR